MKVGRAGFKTWIILINTHLVKRKTAGNLLLPDICSNQDIYILNFLWCNAYQCPNFISGWQKKSLKLRHEWVFISHCFMFIHGIKLMPMQINSLALLLGRAPVAWIWRWHMSNGRRSRCDECACSTLTWSTNQKSNSINHKDRLVALPPIPSIHIPSRQPSRTGQWHCLPVQHT